MIPDIAVGAIGAALIGAIISFVGLIIAKESKVSEFRQAWIDDLRSELSKFLANVNAVVDAQYLSFDSSNERFEKLQPYFSSLNETYYLVALRLNDDEQLAKNLKSCMVSISTTVTSGLAIDQLAFEKARIEYISLSNRLLKIEWTRVKDGEPVFQATRKIAAAAFIFLVITALVVAIIGSGILSRNAKTVSSSAKIVAKSQQQNSAAKSGKQPQVLMHDQPK